MSSRSITKLVQNSALPNLGGSEFVWRFILGDTNY